MGVNKRGIYIPWGYMDENDYTSSKTQFELELDKLFAMADYKDDDKFIHFYNLDGEEIKDAAIDTTKFAGGVIESATYDKETKILTITFTNGDVVEINLADLIDENEFADGLTVDEGIVKVLIDPDSDPYLTVSEDGVKIAGIKDKFDEVDSSITEINSSITEINSSITEINSAITNIEGDITEINSAITNIEGDITEINSAITNIEGDITEINSSITEINSAITNIEGDIIEINSAITNVEGDIININSSITEINSAITNIEGDIININSAITQIEENYYYVNSAITNLEENYYIINSALTEDYYNKEEISLKEKVISAALNDLNNRKFDDAEFEDGKIKFYSTNEGVKTLVDEVELGDLDLSDYYKKEETSGKTELEAAFNEKLDVTAYTPVDLTNYYTKDETSGKTELETEFNKKLEEDDIANFFDDAEYDSSAKTINFYHGDTLKAQIDATDFVKDGMVDNVEVKTIVDTADTSVTVNVLAITFNADADKEEIDIPIADIFDADNYYTKNETDALLDEKIDVDFFTYDEFGNVILIAGEY